MRCNFTVRDFILLRGDLGEIDIHNAYDLASYELNSHGRVFRMAFAGNQYRLPTGPKGFDIRFTEVDTLEITDAPADLTDFCVHEVVFMAAAERGYDDLPAGETPEPGQHMVFIGETAKGARATIRVHAASAELLPRA